MDDNKTSTSIVDDTSPQCRKVNPKRRSSFFQRRSVIPQDVDESTNSCNNKDRGTGPNQNDNDTEERENKENETDGDRRKEAFDTQAYIDGLNAERKAWRRLLAERQREHRRLLKNRESMLNRAKELDLSVLSDSERSFLLARPNYEQICENVQKLSDMAVRTIVLNDLVVKLHEKFMCKSREMIDILTVRVIDMVD